MTRAGHQVGKARTRTGKPYFCRKPDFQTAPPQGAHGTCRHRTRDQVGAHWLAAAPTVGSPRAPHLPHHGTTWPLSPTWPALESEMRLHETETLENTPLNQL